MTFVTYQLLLLSFYMPYMSFHMNCRDTLTGKHTEFPRLDALHVLDASARFKAGSSGCQTF